MHNDEHSHKAKEGQVVECQHCEGAGKSRKDCCIHTAKMMPWDEAPCCVCKGEKVVHV